MKLLLSIFTIILFWNFSISQSDFKTSDFLTDGSTKLIGDRCFQLVPDEARAAGSLWHRKAIDLRSPFDIALKVMLGCEDEMGADGIVLAFSPRPTRTGWSGEGMGFAGLSPSLGIEIDTWQNDHLFDPEEDHLAIMANGNIQHYSNLAGPKKIPNIEDCKLHNLRIKWTPSTNRLVVTLDGKYQIAYTGNIIHTIFMDNPNVYWGITAATGRYSNRHEFCIEKLDYVTPKIITPNFDVRTQKRLLAGENVTLKQATFPSGSTKLSPDARAAAEQLYRFLKRYPRQHVSISGHTDSGGSESTNLKLSELRAKAIADYLKEKGIAPERIKSSGYGERFPIQSNASAKGRASNRRIDIFVFVPQA